MVDTAPQSPPILSPQVWTTKDDYNPFYFSHPDIHGVSSVPFGINSSHKHLHIIQDDGNEIVVDTRDEAIHITLTNEETEFRIDQILKDNFRIQNSFKIAGEKVYETLSNMSLWTLLFSNNLPSEYRNFREITIVDQIKMSAMAILGKSLSQHYLVLEAPRSIKGVSDLENTNPDMHTRELLDKARDLINKYPLIRSEIKSGILY